MKIHKIIFITILATMGLSVYYCKPEEIILHGEINGTVTDALTNKPLHSVTVRLESINDSIKTGVRRRAICL